MDSQWVKTILIGSNPKRTLLRTLLLASFCFVLFKYFLMPCRLHGSSMEPTYHDGGFRFVNRMEYRRAEPQRGDVVAIRLAGEKTFYLKRIIALPSETVSIEKGQVYVNGVALEEPYLVRRGSWTMKEQVIPAGHYYVAGDNRENSIRLHKHGVVQRKRIAGAIL